MYNPIEIINGIKLNDRKIWEYLYKHFYPLAKSYILNKSGDVDDVKDVMQETFYKIFEKCSKDFEHDNILALTMTILKNTWIDMLRKRKHNTNKEISENDLKVDKSYDEPNSISSSKFNLSKVISLSKSITKKLNINSKIEDFLDYRNLNEIQRKMIDVLIDQAKTNPVCKKLLMLTHFLPISDNILVANEMGYILSNSPENEKKGLDKLKTQKARCIKRFKESLGIKK